MKAGLTAFLHMDYTETINTTFHFHEDVTVANKAETGKDANETIVGRFGSSSMHQQTTQPQEPPDEV